MAPRRPVIWWGAVAGPMPKVIGFVSPRHRWLHTLYSGLRRARVPVRDAILGDGLLRLLVGGSADRPLSFVVRPAGHGPPAYGTAGPFCLGFEGRRDLGARERAWAERMLDALRTLGGEIPPRLDGFSAICLPTGEPHADVARLFPFLDVERSSSERGADVEVLVRVTSRCNQACPFCSAPEHAEPSPEALLASWSAVSRLLPGATLTLTGGEPTVRPRFLDEVATARALDGIGRVHVQTNAVGFGSTLDPAVLPPGPDLTFFVSLHAVDERIYDACTGTRGQLPRALAGVRRLLEAGHDVTLNTVVTRHNLDHLEPMVRALCELLPGEVRPALCFSALMCPERRPGAADLLVRYSDLVPALERAAAAAAERGLAVQSLLSSTHASIPACLLSESSRAVPGRTAPSLHDDETGYETDDTPWVKAARCRSCVETDGCLGVPQPYARRFGLEELVPLRGGGADGGAEGGAGGGQSGEPAMLHVLAGAHCNNHCVFCMESDREGRRRHVSSQTPGDIRRFIEAHPGRGEVLFTSGEPTLNPDLDRYVEWARAAGYRTIAVITNGRRLSQPKYAAALLARGVNKLTLSVHAAEPELHDELTRSRGAFRQTLRGLENLAALRRRGARFDLHTSTVVVRANLPRLREIHRLLRRFDVDRMCFNVMMVKGFGRERFGELMPRYSDVVAEVAGLVRGLPREELVRIALADVPPCVTVELPEEVRAAQERFVQFEKSGSVGISDTDLERVAGSGADVPLARLVRRAGAAELSGDDAYYVTDRDSKDDILRIKRELCEDCAMSSACPGVWRGYVEAFGWSELVPVRSGPGGRARRGAE